MESKVILRRSYISDFCASNLDWNRWLGKELLVDRVYVMDVYDGRHYSEFMLKLKFTMI